jgi:hypothetical protein
MLKCFDISNIIIECIINDSIGYNLGDLLNMPYLSDTWNSSPHAGKGLLNRMEMIGKTHKDSILYYYCLSRKELDENIPNINRIRDAVEEYKNNNNKQLEEIKKIVTSPDVCCIHVRNGDQETEQDFIDIIIKLANEFKQIIILSGIHSDIRFKNKRQKETNFINTINNILNMRDNIYLYLNNADAHLTIMSFSTNLLVHKGGFSCLGTIVCSGNLFITKHFKHAYCKNWKQYVNKKYILLT